MPATPIVPAARSYTAPLNALRANWRTLDTPDHDLRIGGSIDWGTDSDAGRCIEINLEAQNTEPFRQIAAISCNNIFCGADVQFLFPDTWDVVTVPAYTVLTSIVATASRKFIVLASRAIAGDQTFFQIYNNAPPPVSLAKVEFQSTAIAAALDATASGTRAVTPAAPTVINGTLTNLNIEARIAGGTTNVACRLQDRATTPNILWSGGIMGGAGAVTAQLLADLQGVRLRFVGGLDLVVTVVSAPAALSVFDVNAYYRAG